MEKEKYLEDNAAQFTTNEHGNEVEKPVEYFCGIGKFRPKCLQIFRNPYFFTFLLCCNAFVEGALVSGFTSVVLSSLERRYQLSSLQVGLVASVFDMSVLVFVIFVSYFAGKGHKPRWMGVSLLIQGLGALIFALPEFIFGSYNVSEGERLESCLDGVEYTPCETGESNSYSLVFFYVGNILIGIGAAALFTVGPSYIDDIVRPKYVSLHLGFFFMWTILGPALGFGLGAAFLSIYVDFWEETSLTPSNPAWVGAWWLCFLFAAVLSWILAIPFLMFPKLPPGSHLVKAEREKEMAKLYKAKHGEDDNVLKKVVSFPRHFIQVLTTPSWIFITAAISSSAFVVTGVTAFAPKFYETQFSLTAAIASISAGAVAIPTGAVGVLVGAVIIFLTKSRGRTVALINWIVTLLSIPPLFIFLVHCPTTLLAGVNIPFADGAQLELKGGPTYSSCNSFCNCTSSVYEPVCGSDQTTYFSPCFAGCEKTFLDNRTIFENCACVAANLGLRQSLVNDSTMFMSDDELLDMSTVTEGVCDTGCKNLGIFLGISIVALFFLFILQVPNIFITIRCVADEQRTLSLGMQSFFFRLLGNVPGPIVFGVVFDTACIYFRIDLPCLRRGNCWVYDNFQLSWSILIMVMIGIFANLIFSFCTWLVYPKQNVSGNTVPLTNKQAATELSPYPASEEKTS